jgi:hypothetical protein
MPKISPFCPFFRPKPLISREFLQSSGLAIPRELPAKQPAINAGIVQFK